MSFYVPHSRVMLDCGTQEITKQSHKQECDINFILKQYQRTGILSHINNNSPLYTDLPDNYDYQESLHIIMRAQDSFASLPSKVRDYFENDPSKFLAAFSDASQADKLREFGLLNPAPAAPSAAPADAPSAQ